MVEEAPRKVKYFYDTEFIEDGSRIDPISIGMVCEDGREYYAEFRGVSWNRANEFVLAHVKPQLTGEVKLKGLITKELRDFVGPDPEFWAYYGDYDHVLLCQLFGTMMDLPAGWPKYTMDLKQYAVTQGNPPLPAPLDDRPHHALADARWVKECYDWLHERDLETRLRNALEELWVHVDDWARARVHPETQALAVQNHNVLAHWRRLSESGSDQPA